MHRNRWIWAGVAAAALALTGCSSRGESDKPGSEGAALYGDNAGETDLGNTTSGRPDPEGTGGSGGQMEDESEEQNAHDLHGEEQRPGTQPAQERGSGAADPGAF